VLWGMLISAQRLGFPRSSAHRGAAGLRPAEAEKVLSAIRWGDDRVDTLVFKGAASIFVHAPPDTSGLS
jgi:hypothetical protein